MCQDLQSKDWIQYHLSFEYKYKTSCFFLLKKIKMIFINLIPWLTDNHRCHAPIYTTQCCQRVSSHFIWVKFFFINVLFQFVHCCITDTREVDGRFFFDLIRSWSNPARLTGWIGFFWLAGYFTGWTVINPSRVTRSESRWI